jgi:NAD(P)H-hydrate epimerase
MELKPLTASEMKEFEKYACDNFDITIDTMMQNAGNAVFDVTMDVVKPGRVLVVAGKGNNGGDALVTARLLKEKGIDVTVLNTSNYQPSAISYQSFDLIIDALFGFSLKGDPRSPADKIIEQINCSQTPVLSVDVPSGLDAETGQIMKPTVKATYTVTLGMPKIGLDKHKEYVGKLYLGDLGIPQKAYQKLDIYTPIFHGKTYVALD